MKKVVFFVVLVIGVVGTSFAQSTQRIIGTWVDNNTGRTWVFNANGTVTGFVEDNDPFEYKFGFTDTKLAISDRGDLDVFNISISSDGRTLILVMDVLQSSVVNYL
jgi:hypothetical protein